jgi:hypothetical protein
VDVDNSGRAGGAKLFGPCGKSKRRDQPCHAATPARNRDAIETQSTHTGARSSRAAPSDRLTYVVVTTSFTRLCRSSVPTVLWSQHGEAHLPSAQHAAGQDARISCAYGNEVGSQDPRSPPQEGAKAVDGSHPGQIRGSLTRLERRMHFRDARESPEARTCAASRRRGSVSEPACSRFG